MFRILGTNLLQFFELQNSTQCMRVSHLNGFYVVQITYTHMGLTYR